MRVRVEPLEILQFISRGFVAILQWVSALVREHQIFDRTKAVFEVCYRFKASGLRRAQMAQFAIGQALFTQAHHIAKTEPGRGVVVLEHGSNN